MKTTGPLQFLVLLVAGWLQRSQANAIAYLLAENRVLRGRLSEKRLRLADADKRLLAEKGRPLGQRALRAIASLATPETIFRWYRELVAKKYDGSSKRHAPGRPPTAAAIEKRLLAIARENPTWGYTRLRGAMANLGHDLARNTIARILRDNGIEPAPRRGRTMSWNTFLKAHLGAIAAADFFSVEVLTRGGLVRYLVMFLIDLKTRRVHIASISSCIDGAFMAQVARSLTAFPEDFLHGRIKKLIVDRDPLYTAQFEKILRDAGVELLRLPARSPNLNAFAERFVRSVKSECLAKIIPIGEAHLRTIVREYVEHYHHERNHQGLDNVIPLPRGQPATTGRVRRSQRLGGILSFYHRDAA